MSDLERLDEALEHWQTLNDQGRLNPLVDPLAEAARAYRDLLANRERVERERDEPLLGLATTRELLDELRARIEVDGKLDYRTVDGGNTDQPTEED